MTDLRELLKKAIPYLQDEGAKYDDDGSNEPLELAREIEDALAAQPAPGGEVGLPEPFGFYDSEEEDFNLFAQGADPHGLDQYPEITYLYSRDSLRTYGDARAAAAVAVPEGLIEIGRRLIADRMQNDHFTADPIYTVQREDRIYRVQDGEGDGFIWVEDGEEVEERKAARLERRSGRGWALPERFERIEYRARWQFVDAYLSYEAAKERVEYEKRKHSGLYRTYVESGHRNHEWKALQAFLMLAAAPQPAAAKDSSAVAQDAPEVWLNLCPVNHDRRATCPRCHDSKPPGAVHGQPVRASPQPLLTAADAPLSNAEPQPGPESLPDFLDRIASELIERDTRAGNFAAGVADSLRGRADILRNVDGRHAKDNSTGGDS